MSPLPRNTREWPKWFETNGLDCILDPMVVRAAELFIGGPDYCRRMTQNKDGEFWPAIENNLDGVLSFFHILMTRDHIPLVNYGQTFMTELPQWLGPSILVWADAAGAYEDVKQKALARLAESASNLPKHKSLDLDSELLSVGYFWKPSLGAVSVAPEAVAAAQFVLGGLIFGEYARASNTDHVLQTKRLNMLTGLGKKPKAAAPEDWRRQEQELFGEINKLASRDKALRTKNETALPSVLLHLVAQGIRKPRALLDEALELRDSAAGKSYRVFHKRLRNAWRLGLEDKDAEKDIADVATELERRLSGEPTILTHVIVEGSAEAHAHVKADAGVAGAGVNATVKVAVPETKIPVVIPQGLRNWFVDNVVLSRHQKLLLHMAKNQHSFERAREGLRTIWQAA
ncbi:MAG: hypothetical protein U1E60_24115 [Reyranellaceae bacterium]